jgi:hypothetical protein
MILARARFVGFALPLASALASLALAAQAAPAPALGEQVAAALSQGARASALDERDGVAKALSVIERSGAHPLPNWNGPDPVPGWRTFVPDETPPMRGSSLGPGYRSGQVLAGRSEKFEQIFLSGQKASIALSTPGSAPLSLRVLDSDANPVCVSRNGRHFCRWVPLFTQRYVIEVRNPGDTVADYFLVVD